MTGTRAWTTGTILLLGAAAAMAGAPPPDLRRDLESYFALGARFVRLPDVTLDSACNVGVDCARPPAGGGRCGRMVLGRGTFAFGSQVAADEVQCTKPGLRLWQLFRNGGSCGDVSIQIVPPQSFLPPIVPGTCADGCVPDVEALEAACGFPTPFPSCDPGVPVAVRVGKDCDGAADAQPGNGRCDLAPGAYGTVRVDNDAHLGLDDGNYALCGLTVGRRAEVTAGETTIAIPESYDVRIGNSARLGFTCGLLQVIADGAGSVVVGRRASVAARLCALERRVRLGTDTTFLGRVVADEVLSGRGLRAVCCCAECPETSRHSPRPSVDEW